MDVKGYIFKKEYFVNDTLNGISIVYFPGAKFRSKTEYKMGKLDGISSTYYSDGRVKEEVSYKNNVRDGASKWYFQRFSTLVNEDRVNVEYTDRKSVV